MSESTNVVTNESTSALDTNLDEQAKRDARNARRRELRAAKKTVAAKPAKKATKVKAAPKTSKARTPRAESKTAQARDVFTRMYGTYPRKDVINVFINDVGLTANGASTYYQKLKKEV